MLFDSILFDQSGVVQLLAASLIVGAALWSLRAGFQRITTTRKKRRLLVSIAIISASLGLLGLILQPQLRVESPTKVMLFTGDYPERDQALKTPVYWVQNDSPKGNLAKEFDNTINSIQLAEQIKYDYPQVVEIDVYGDGLSNIHWQTLGNVKLNYSLPKRKTGFVNTRWSQQVNLGKSMQVGGQIQLGEDLTSPDPLSQALTVKNQTQSTGSNTIVTVSIKDPAGETVATKTLVADEYFSFATKPKVPGHHQYVLEARLGDRLIAKEKLSLEVTNTSILKLLIIQSSPSFETRHLQNWASVNQAEVLVKTTISKNRYISTALNYQESTKQPVSRELFDKFDLLIIDGRGLLALDLNQQDSLLASANEGLGLFVLLDQSLLKQYRTDQFSATPAVKKLLEGFDFASADTSSSTVFETEIFWSDNQGGLVKAATPFTPITSIQVATVAQSDAETQLIALGSDQQPLIIAKQLGAGAIAISRVKQTYRWVTAGEAVDHSHYWQSLIERLGRANEQASFYWPEPEKLWFAEQQHRICLKNATGEHKLSVIKPAADSNHASVVSIEALSITLNPVVGSVNTLCGYFWSGSSGWYQFNLYKNSKLEVSSSRYLNSKAHWLAMLQAEKIRATKQKQNAYRTQPPAAPTFEWQAANLWVFWWLFFLGVSVLWLEKKQDEFS